MYVSGCKFEDGPGYVEGYGGEDDRVVVEVKADVDVVCKCVYSASCGCDHFCTFVEEEG